MIGLGKGMRKQLKIFIASSIVEFASTRDDIENYLWKYRDKNNVDVVPIRCETSDPSMSVTRKEDDYCSLIFQSDVCLFLFSKNLGKYSLEEYEYSKEIVKRNHNLKIIVFFEGDYLSSFKNQVIEDGFETYDLNENEDIYRVLDIFIKENGKRIEEHSSSLINIFFASSIDDDVQERIKIENFIYKMNYEFVNSYNISIRPLLPHESDLQSLIIKSKMCFFIIFKKVEKEVKDELDFAKQYFDKTGLPKIYVYFNSITDFTSKEKSVIDFKEYLDKQLNHFYGTFNGIDTIKLRILLNLAIQETGSKQVIFKNGKCYLNDDALISIDQVSEFKNNQKLIEFKQELNDLDERYHVLKKAYESDRMNEALGEEYYNVATRYLSLKNKIEKLEESIFNITLSLSNDEVKGTLSLRQKRAYRYFEEGNVELAVELLDVDETLKSYESLSNITKMKAREVISEGRLKIDFLKTMYQYKNRHEMIEDTYKKILPVALSSQVELNIYDEYALFLLSRERHNEAINQASTLMSFYSLFPHLATPEAKSDNYLVLATIYNKMSDHQEETKKYSLEALNIKEKIYEDNKDDEKNNYGISQICLALGNIYRREQKALLAESYLSKGESLLLDLSHISKKYLLDLSRILIIKGQNYFDRFKGDEALSCYKRAEECMLKLPLDNPEEKYQLSSCYQNSGALFRKLCKKEEALKMFTKSRDIRLKLADDDPISFLPTLAYSYQGVGNALRSLDRKDEALDSYFHAYKIRKMISKKNPNVHDAEMSDSAMKIASVYLDKKDPDLAYPYIKETISLRERLYKISNDTYFKWYAQSIFELGRYHEEKNNIEEAKQNYLESLHLQTSKDIDIPTNAEALHLIFKKLKEIYKEDFLKVLSPKEKEVHDDLYSYNDKHPDNKIVFDPLYQD